MLFFSRQENGVFAMMGIESSSAETSSENSGRRLQGRADFRQQLTTHFAGRKRLIHFDLDEPYWRIGLKLADQVHIGRNDRADHEVATARNRVTMQHDR